MHNTAFRSICHFVTPTWTFQHCLDVALNVEIGTRGMHVTDQVMPTRVPRFLNLLECVPFEPLSKLLWPNGMRFRCVCCAASVRHATIEFRARVV